MNADKCRLLITIQVEDVSNIIIGGEIITSSKSVKLLSIKIDNKLEFNELVSSLCQ